MYKYILDNDEDKYIYLQTNTAEGTTAISIYNESTGEFRLYRNNDTGAYPLAGNLPITKDNAVMWHAGEILYISVKTSLDLENTFLMYLSNSLNISDKINNEYFISTKEKVDNTIEYKEIYTETLLSAESDAYSEGYIYTDKVSELSSFVYYAIPINTNGYFWLNSSANNYSSIDSITIINEINAQFNRFYRTRDTSIGSGPMPYSEETKKYIAANSILYLNTNSNLKNGLADIIYLQEIKNQYCLNNNVPLTDQMKSEINEMVDSNTGAYSIIETVLDPLSLNEQPTVEILSGYYHQQNGMVQLSAYTTWVYQFDHDIQVYTTDVLAAPGATPYLSISICYNTGYIDGTAKSWFRNYNNSVGLPTSANPLTVLAGEYLIISRQSSSFNSEVYIIDSTSYKMQLSSNINLAQYHINQVKSQIASSTYKSNKVKYENSGNGGLYIAQAQVYGYVVWEFHHFYSELTNADGWRINIVYLYDDAMNMVYNLSTNGEWECALHLAADKTNNKKRIDFSGLGLHGDEVYNDIKFLIDGAWYSEEDLNKLSSWTEFKNITVYENSKLYDPGTGDSSNTLTQMQAGELTEIANHYKRYIFEGTKCTIYQKIEWLINDTTTSCYLAMFPIAKSVSSYIIDNTNFIQKDLANGYYNSTTAKSITMINDSDEICIRGSFSILNYDCGGTQYGNFSSTDNNGNAYNKCYYYCKAGDIAAGEIWNTTTEYEWFIGIPYNNE